MKKRVPSKKLFLNRESLTKIAGSIIHRTTLRCHQTLAATFCANSHCESCWYTCEYTVGIGCGGGGGTTGSGRMEC